MVEMLGHGPRHNSFPSCQRIPIDVKSLKEMLMFWMCVQIRHIISADLYNEPTTYPEETLADIQH